LANQPTKAGVRRGGGRERRRGGVIVALEMYHSSIELYALAAREEGRRRDNGREEQPLHLEIEL
jgi:hypothetical protein